MTYSSEKVAGVLFFAAVTQFILGLAVAEALYPGFNLSGQYISDLGVGPSAMVFNSSVFILGLLLALGTYFLRHTPEFKTMSILLFLMAVAAMGVGVFTSQFTIPHVSAASAAFFFAGLSAIVSAKVVKRPLSLIGIVLGVMTLAALGLYSAGIITSGSLTSDIAYESAFYLGLGPGGMEHMVVYPAIMWLAWFSGHLATQPEK